MSSNWMRTRPIADADRPNPQDLLTKGNDAWRRLCCSCKRYGEQAASSHRPLSPARTVSHQGRPAGSPFRCRVRSDNLSAMPEPANDSTPPLIIHASLIASLMVESEADGLNRLGWDGRSFTDGCRVSAPLFADEPPYVPGAISARNRAEMVDRQAKLFGFRDVFVQEQFTTRHLLECRVASAARGRDGGGSPLRADHLADQRWRP